MMERDPSYAAKVLAMVDLKPTAIDPAFLPPEPEAEPKEWEKWYA